MKTLSTVIYSHSKTVQDMRTEKYQDLIWEVYTELTFSWKATNGKCIKKVVGIRNDGRIFIVR